MDENNSSTATTIEDELNSLRSVLRSDEHLQIQPSGDFEQVRLKLDHDIQISFFFDALQVLGRSLTISALHDLRISKGSTKCPLNQDQWTSVRKSFDELVQQSDSGTSLRTLVQLVQDHLLQLRVTTRKFKPKEKKTTSSAATVEDETLTSNRFRGGDLIFNRILHDKAIDRSQVVIGYEDRFTGMHEIPFNEFKKVHDHEYGVPMHRLRYFKIGGRTVWDRTKRIDTLTGSDQQNGTEDIGQSVPATQGLYHFDQCLEQWVSVPCTSLASDDTRAPSTNDTCLPQQPHLLTWNILFDYHHTALIHTQQRYPAILNTLKTLLPDLIALQEVTAPFLRLLLNEPWLQQHNYHIIIMQSVISSEQGQSYGQVMLMKSFRPRAFSILPLDVLHDTVATTTARKSTKEVIIARFGLSARVTIDVVNLHLHSNRSRNADDKRCQALEKLFASLQTHNYMLVGDFNFGDFDLKEQALLQRHESDVHDVWRDAYDLDETPGFTFDPSRNMCASIMSETQIKRRFDRFLVHTLQNVYYSVQHLEMVGIDTIPIDPANSGDSDKRVNLSDHYGVQLVADFRTRSISHRSALVVVPPSDHWTLIDEYRREFDPSFGRWPAHINVLWPFFDLTGCEDDEQSILLPLRMALSGCTAFEAEVAGIETFVENNVCYMKLGDESRAKVKGLHELMKQLFPQCSINRRSIYNPHMTIAQFDNEDKRVQAKSSLTLKAPFHFAVPYLYILQRPHDNDTTPFHIAYQLPLGPVLHPLHSQQLHSVDSQLQLLCQQMHLYEDQQAYHRKQDKLNKLAACFSEMFNSDTLHCFTHSFLPYGSFRIGVKGEDVDTVFVLNEVKSSGESRTSFDETLLAAKGDSSALSGRVVELLETQINGSLKDEISHYRKVQALYPILVIMFHDQTKVEIFVQAQTIQQESDATKVQANVDNERFIHGVHEIEHVLVHARSPPIFQHLLAFVRAWAQQVGLYGQVYGYLSGFSWAILCADICHSFLSPIHSLSSIEHFTIDDFFALVHNFFATFARFNWPAQALRLHPESSQQTIRSDRSSVHNRGSMRILSPIPPYNNTGRSTINSTRDLVAQGFQRVVDLLDGMNTTTTEEKSAALQQMLQLEKQFPSEQIRTLLQVTLIGADATELDEWVGWLKSRLAHFLHECESDCHLSVQTQNSVELRASNNEAVYSIGFQLDEVALDSQRNFHYSLTRFVEQLNLCPNRKESMKISHKLVSVHDWKLARMQPKPQRTRK